MGRKTNIAEYWGHREPHEHKEKGQIRRMKLIADLAKKGRILDIGYYNKPNPFLKGDVYGVDINSGRKFFNYKKTYKADLDEEPLPFKRNFFDSIIIAETLEHIQNLKHILTEIHRVLKPNGVLIVSIPNMYNPNHMVMELLGKVAFEGAEEVIGLGHVHSFMPADLKTVMGKHGFKVQKIFGSYVKLPFTNIQIWVGMPSIAEQQIYVIKKLT